MTVNSKIEIQQRVTAGKITCTGLLIMLAARSVLAVVCQALVATLFFAGNANGWNEAGEWFRVYGTAIDVGTIALLVWLARREGIRLFDTGSYSREHWLRDVLIGPGLFILIFPLAMILPGMLIGFAIYSGPAPGLVGNVPMVGFLYSLIIWPITRAFAEDNTYFGYLLPRIEALTRSRWLAVVVVGFFWGLQHIFMPFNLEWRYLVYRFVTSIPIVIVFCLLYFRQRRLLPIHVMHWLANVISILLFALMPVTGGG